MNNVDSIVAEIMSVDLNDNVVPCGSAEDTRISPSVIQKVYKIIETVMVYPPVES